jgi:hypothetical protein
MTKEKNVQVSWDSGNHQVVTGLRILDIQEAEYRPIIFNI